MLHYDSNKLNELLESFKNAEQRVHTVLLNTKAGTVQELKVKLNKSLDKVSLSLTEKAKEWANQDLKDAYNEGVVSINGKSDKKLAQSEDVVLNSYIELSTKVHTATEHARTLINNAIQEAERSKYGATVGSVKEIIQETLYKENASMVVEYSNGTKMPLDSYAQMLARTSRIESSNTGAFDRCKKLNIDLVRCTTMPGCCPYCKKYEGKVYSISGNDKRFPALYKTALQHGYNIMHPNCRHEFIPFVESMQTAEQLEQIVKDSNHFEQLSKNDKVFKTYNQNQATLRQWRSEMNEYNKLKDQYGNDMPYTSLGGFRRGRRANSETYKKLVSTPVKTTTTKRKPKSSYKIIKEPEKYVNKASMVAVQQELKTFIKSVDISKLKDLENANIVTQQLKAITQKYGIKISKIDTKVTVRRANASATADTISLTPKYFNEKHKPGLSFKKRSEDNIAYYKNIKDNDPKLYAQYRAKVDRALAELEEQKNYERFTFADESGKIEDTVLHECGHLIHNQLFGMGPHGYIFRTDDTKSKADLELGLQRRNKWQFEVFSKLRYNKDIHKISYYANDNERECFAECFVAYETGRELPSYVEDFFNDLFGGKRK